MKAPEECNYILDDVTGTIKSPNFPVEYPHHTNCSWRIKAPQNCTVKLNFSHFSLEYRHDNLTIYDGYDNSSSSVKFSGWYLPDPFYSTGRHLYIELNADGDVQWSGFLATYVSGKLLKPLILTYSAPHTVRYFATSDPLCKYSCTVYERERYWLSDSFKCRSEDVKSGGTLSGECSHVLDNDTGIIKSPNFPLDYPDGVLCSWKITVYEGCRIKLKFLHFALESGYDGLIIYDGYNTSSSSVTLSGWHLPDAYQSTGSSLFIKMKTDEDIPKSGFLATYTSGKQMEN
ncbi:CUB domain protein, partial [Opisthorchis viverrini]